MDNKKKTVLVTALIVALIGCVLLMSGYFGQTGALLGQTQNEQVVVSLPVQPWAYWTAFYTADNQGYYAAEGINVSFVYVAEGGFGVIKQVAAKTATFGHAGIDALLLARSKDMPVMTIYQDAHSSSWNIIAKERIKSLKDLEGKTVAIQGPNGPPHLAALAMLKKEGVNTDSIKWVPVGGQAMVSTFLGGNADAIAGNDLYEIILKKQNAKFNIWYAKDYGVELPAMSPLASEITIKNNPELVEKFLRATKKGEQYAIAHPEDAVEAYVKKFNPSANKDIELALWKKYVAEVILPDKFGLGQFNKEQWKTTHDTLLELGVLDKEVELKSAYTEEFLKKI